VFATRLFCLTAISVLAGTKNSRPVGFYSRNSTKSNVNPNTTIHKYDHHGGAVCPSYGMGSMDTPDRTRVTSSEGVALMFADSFEVEIPNNIGIRYYVIMYFLPPFSSPPHRQIRQQIAPTPCNRKINARNINIVRFCRSISSRRPASQRRFSEGRFITPLSCSFPKTSPDEKQ